MKRILTYVAAGLLLIGAQSLMAQSTTNSVPTKPGAHQGDRRERMEHLLKILDLKREDLKGLTPQERQAKIKDRAETVVSDLKAKQSAGTLSDEGQKKLKFLENYLAHAGKHHNKSEGATTPTSSSSSSN